MTNRFLLLLAALQSAFAGNIAITSLGPTQTQMVVRYTATSASPCTISVSDLSGIGVTVWDVDATKFSGANLDLSRPDTLADGLTRTVVIGHRSVEKASDGLFYSRALQVATPHQISVACQGGTDTGGVIISTENAMLGSTYPEMPGFDSQNLWNYAFPGIDYTVAGKQKVYIDPLTGVAVKRVTGPGEATSRLQQSQTFAAAIDNSGGSWTTPGNATAYGTTNYASTSAAGANLFLSWGNIQLYGSPFGGLITGIGDSIDDLLVRIRASSSDGATGISGCISVDAKTCYTAMLTATPGASAADLTLPQSAFPSVPWQSWGGKIPPRHLLTGPDKAVSVNASTVTIPSPNVRDGNAFDTEWPVGMPLKITGTDPACPNNICTLAAVNSTVSLTINENPGNIGAQTLTPLNGGVLLWISSGSGTISLNANFDFAHSTFIGLDGSDGTLESCSRVSDTTTVNPDGTEAGRPLKGFLCKFGSGSVYFFDTETGSSRFLSNNFFSYIGSGSEARGAGNYPVPFQPFDTTDSRTWYTFAIVGDTTQSTVLYKSTYTGNFANNPMPYPINPEPPNVTQSLYTSLYPNDIGSQFSQLIATLPNFNTTMWGTTLGQNNFFGFHPNGYATFMVTRGQDTAGWYFAYDLKAKRFTGALSSFAEPSARWSSFHSGKPTGTGGYSWAGGAQLRGNCGGCELEGPYDMPLDKVWRSTGGTNGTWDTNTSLGPDELYACPADTSAYWDERGANNCLRWHTTGEPCRYNPATQKEKDLYPCPWDANKSMFMTAQVGDLVTDRAGGCRGCERLKIIKKIKSSETDIEWWAYRKAYPHPYPPQYGPSTWTHANGWLPSMSALGWDAPILWANLANPAQWYPEYPFVANGHPDIAAAAPKPYLFNIVGGGALYKGRLTLTTSDIGKPDSYSSAGTPVFDNSPAGSNGWNQIENYTSGKQYLASDTEKYWIADWRTPQDPNGTGPETPQTFWPNTMTGPVSGATNVYEITQPAGWSAPDVKRHPLFGYAGRWRLNDISGPGSLIDDSRAYSFCYAYLNGECRPGSAAGKIYVNVPMVETGMGCLGNQFSIHAPCVFSYQSNVGFAIQKEVLSPDPNGTRFRRLTGMFQPVGRSSHYQHLRPAPDGKWGFYSARQAGNYRDDLFAARIPTWNGSEDGNQRWTWTNLPVSLTGSSGAKVRVKFGYDLSFRCSSRNEPCYTDGSGAQPFLFASETQHPSACDGACTLHIPAVPNRVVFYRVEWTNSDASAVVNSSDTQITVAP